MYEGSDTIDNYNDDEDADLINDGDGNNVKGMLVVFMLPKRHED